MLLQRRLRILLLLRSFNRRQSLQYTTGKCESMGKLHPGQMTNSCLRFSLIISILDHCLIVVYPIAKGVALHGYGTLGRLSFVPPPGLGYYETTKLDLDRYIVRCCEPV